MNNLSSQCSIFNMHFKEHCNVLFNTQKLHLYLRNVFVAAYDYEIHLNFS